MSNSRKTSSSPLSWSISSISSISSTSTSSSSCQQYAFANWKCQTLERHLRVSKLDFVCCPTNVRAPASWNKHTYKGFSKWQLLNARSVKPCFVFGLAHQFSLFIQSFFQNLKNKLIIYDLGNARLNRHLFKKGLTLVIYYLGLKKGNSNVDSIFPGPTLQ